ncbi:MAG: CRISPR-associated protein Cas4 [Nitrospirota bacterium]|nr:CRISPR-associated protein Cas4 [Nitrospirota bacterium]
MTMYQQEPIMISALNHYLYCPRRCGLVHVEQVWSENLYTMRGTDVHENVDVESSHELSDVRYERTLPIWSRRLNLTGKADLVEFHDGIPYPVEYKSGRHKEFENDFTQLCAQAICLEEMLNVNVEKGAIYWHASRERKEIVFTATMRSELERVAASVHDIIARQHVPPPVNDKRCKDCSLNESCMPAVVGDKGKHRRSAREMFVISGGKEG